MNARRLAATLGAVLCMGAAADPADRLADPAKEIRARAIFRETRCLVCQGESIDDSDAELASDLRRIIRGQVTAGASDDQVRAFLVARYGEFVLLKPRFEAGTILLWGTPFAVLMVAGAALLLGRRRIVPLPEQPLSEAERQALRKAME